MKKEVLDFKFEGWSINLKGPHMKDKATFVKETKGFWNGDEKVASEAWAAAQKLIKGEQKSGDGEAK